jgi:hypothetical protein
MDSLRRVSSGRPLPYTIPNCIALQVISDVEAPLSEGDLTLQLPTVTHSRSSIDSTNTPSSPSLSTSLSPNAAAAPTSSSSSSSNASPSAPILLAFVGKTLFPLYKDTVFGTFINQPRQYAFDFKLSETTSTQVRLVLPENVQEGVQDEFEEILIQRGLLLQGIRAAGDEIMRGAKESGLANSERLRAGTQE